MQTGWEGVVDDNSLFQLQLFYSQIPYCIILYIPEIIHYQRLLFYFRSYYNYENKTRIQPRERHNIKLLFIRVF